MNIIYEKLRSRLDELSIGFPESETGIELKILERLFTIEDAELFIQLSQMPETPEQISQKTNRDLATLSVHLEDMAKKGLLFRQRRDNLIKYCVVPYMIGIYEFQLKAMYKDLAEKCEEYFETTIGNKVQDCKTGILRTIPINNDITSKLPVAPYEDAFEIIENRRLISLSNCICRTTTQKIDKGCEYPMEVCFQFDTSAEYYIENGLGREITKEEAVEILKANEKAGLVLQPVNDQKVGGMCSCCGCCCALLRSIKMQPVPADAVLSNYYAIVESESCKGCKECETRCPMEAIIINEKKASINLKRCIGCGLCVTSCKQEAITLNQKADDKIYTPPTNNVATLFQIAKERGKTLR